MVATWRRSNGDAAPRDMATHPPPPTTTTANASGISIILRNMRQRADAMREFEKAHVPASVASVRWNHAQPQAARGCSGRWRVAFLHIPKCGGTTILTSLKKSSVFGRACDLHSFGTFTKFPAQSGVCSCANQTCIANARFVSAELPFSHFRQLVAHAPVAAVECTLYLSVVRQPRSWFESALSFFCNTPFGRNKNTACVKNTSAQLMRTRGAFHPTDPTSDWNGDYRGFDSPKYFFRHANLQSTMLGDIYFEANWIICPLERLSDAVERLMPLVIASASKAPGSWRVTVANQRSARTRAYTEGVAWSEVARFYALDDALYRRMAGACVGNIEEPQLAETLRREGLYPQPWR